MSLTGQVFVHYLKKKKKTVLVAIKIGRRTLFPVHDIVKAKNYAKLDK